MKKIFFYIFIFLIFSANSFSATTKRDKDLNKLFEQLEKTSNSSVAFEIEIKIWKIWSTHPTNEELTNLLDFGSNLLSEGKLEQSHKIFSEIIKMEPNWAESWNKRATALYLMGRYTESLKDINEVLKQENRHFGALSGQGLVYIQLKQYEKAINSYKEAQKIYPSIQSSDKMIPQLEELIRKEEI